MTDPNNPPLKVPNHVLDAAYTVVLDSRARHLELGQMSARVLHEAGPLLVAAELRRLADELEADDNRRQAADPLGAVNHGGQRVVQRIRDRADELDGGAQS